MSPLGHISAFGAAGALRAPAAGDPTRGSSGSAEPPGPAEIDALIHELEDPERRAELIDELQVLRQAQTGSDSSQQPLADVDLSNLLAQGREWLGELWHGLLQLDATWVAEHLLWSVVIVVLGFVVYRLLHRAVQRLQRRLAHRDPARSDEPRGVALGKRVLRVALAVVTLTIVLQVWGVSLARSLTRLTELAWVHTAFSVALIGAAALLLWSLSDAIISGTMAAQADRLGNARQRSRLRTVTPLLQGTMRITIGVLALLLILAQLGLDIGPLLAGAGIIGLAVGFGAQSLIKDLLIGVTLLLEDAASVGDIIDIDGPVGEVEAMGIRMLRLRDLDGTLHMIPYSEIARVSNLTKDFAFALLDVRVAYRADVDAVVDSLVQTARELRDDPDLAPLILEDLEVMGVNALADSGVEIRVRLKTLPLERWRIAREFRRRIKSRFDRAGIEIPYPQRVLHFAGSPACGDARSGRLAHAAGAADAGPGD